MAIRDSNRLVHELDGWEELGWKEVAGQAQGQSAQANRLEHGLGGLEAPENGRWRAGLVAIRAG